MKPLKYGKDEHKLRTNLVAGEYVEPESEFYEDDKEPMEDKEHG